MTTQPKIDASFLLAHSGFLTVPTGIGGAGDEARATVLSNLISYGYAPSRALYEAVSLLSDDELCAWWEEVDPLLAHLSGSDRDIATAVVYRNFPAEVLNKSRAAYVMEQILMYLGMSPSVVAETPKLREPIGELGRLKVLDRAGEDTAANLLSDLRSTKARWNDAQSLFGRDLLGRDAIEFSLFGFRENAAVVAAARFEDATIVGATATDVARIAAALSNVDVSLRSKPRFGSFTKSQKRKLLALLEGAPNLETEFSERRTVFRNLIWRLNPKAFGARFPRVSAVVEAARAGTLVSYEQRMDPQVPTTEILDAAAERPGRYLRAFHRFYKLFGAQAVDRLIPMLPTFDTRALLKFERYLRTIGTRKELAYPPRGRWGAVQVRENAKVAIDPAHVEAICAAVRAIVSTRLAETFPEGFEVDPRLADLRIQTNDQKLAEYGRGTRFALPDDVGYIRTSTYWQYHDAGNVWYDNGWNFFDADWKPIGVCSWHRVSAIWDNGADTTGALFSGDPTSATTEDNRACQMIDIYPAALRAGGARYAVWSALCYSGKSFAEAKEVLATLSFGEDAQKGELYDPRLAHMIFPLRSEQRSSHVAYVDLERNELVYMDADLPVSVSSASNNGESLSRVMPAYVEYLGSLPTVHDLLTRHQSEGGTPALMDDAGIDVTTPRAFVALRRNEANSFAPVSVTELLGE